MYAAFRVFFRTVLGSKMAWERWALRFAGHFRAMGFTYVAVATRAYSNDIPIPENGVHRAENDLPQTKMGGTERWP